MKGNKYKVDITGQEIYSDGKTIWTYDKSSNEVTITKVRSVFQFPLLRKNYSPIFTTRIFYIK